MGFVVTEDPISQLLGEGDNTSILVIVLVRIVLSVVLTAIIAALWFVSLPLWKPFMTHILGFAEVEKLFDLVLLLAGFYVLYAFQNVFDSTFYAVGKTNYMLFESVITNTVYYGAAFILYAMQLWTPTLLGIALLFGVGTAFDSLVSLGAYLYFLKKQEIRVF